ncbi:MAG: hypothetical protein EOM20_17780, partial [Spartobacteria bacterium]|nr:hypothetical protein [Spartobacteria bacterium]
LEGRVDIRATAIAMNDSTGEDMNYITLIPKPVDIEITAEDILFSTNRPAVDESVLISAWVHNRGTDALSNIIVRCFANNTQLDSDQMIASLSGNASEMVTWSVVFSNAGARVIRVVADPNDEVIESNELNNDATRILTVGNPALDALMVISATVPSPVCPGSRINVSGTAEYEIDDGGVMVRYPVKGAQVSVQVGVNPAVYATAKTGPAGQFQQYIYANADEQLTMLTVVVTDESIAGVHQLFQQTDTAFCGGGVPRPVVDLSVRSCDGLALDDNSLILGDEVFAEITVRNSGNVTAQNVGLRLYDGGTVVATGQMASISANSAEVLVMTYTLGEPDAAYHLLRAVVTPVAYEQNLQNNQASVLLSAGSPANDVDIGISDFTIVATSFVRQVVTVRGAARYEGLPEQSPAAGARMLVQMDSSTIATGYADQNGQFAINFTAPTNTGEYAISVQADDCSGLANSVSTSKTLSVISLPNEVSIASQNIHFEGAIDQDPHVATGAVFRMYAEFSYAIGYPTNCGLLLRDTFRDCQSGVFATNTLLLTNMWMDGVGTRSVSMLYTADVQASHIISADLLADFGNTNNDYATRVLQVGEVLSNLNVHILAPDTNNLVLPVPYPVEVQVLEETLALAPGDLAHLSLEFSRYPDYQETIQLVENGTLVAGEYLDDAYTYWYDPETSTTNTLKLVVRAGAMNCAYGAAQIQFILCPDGIPPVLTIPEDVEVQCPSQAAIEHAGMATATDDTDPSPVISYVDTITNVLCASQYHIQRAWTATDTCGNSDTAVQTIIVNDTTPPEFVNFNALVNVACHSSVPSLSVTAVDNCDGAVSLDMIETTNLGACVNSYELHRVWTATDACGNSITVEQTIVVQDDLAPILYGVPSSIVVSYAGDTPELPVVSAEDNCDGMLPVVFTETTNDGICAYSYVLVRSWSAEDSCGNVTSVTRTVTFQDDLAPVLYGVPTSLNIGCHDPLPEIPEVTATDNFDEEIAVVFTETGAAACGSYLVRTWRATDSCNNTTTDVQYITVVDTVSPVLVGIPEDAVIESAEFEVPVVTAIDDCTSNMTVSYSLERSGDCPTYATQKWVAVDACGNSVLGTRSLIVSDTTPPVLSRAPTTVHCFDSVPVISPASVSCSDWSPVTVSFVSATTNNGSGLKGDPMVISRSYRGEDACGNIGECIHVITVEDRQAPIFSGVPANQTIVCGTLPPPADVTATDCGAPVAVIMTETTNGLNPVIYTRTWKAWDASGNTNTANQQISVTYCDSIAGEAQYEGLQTGSIYVLAGTDINDWSTNISVTLEQPGVYSIPNLGFPAEYWIRAYRDVNGNHINDYWEPSGAYIGNPVYLTNSATGINLILRDSDMSLDGDNLPDGWEIFYFDDLSAIDEEDPDEDGYTNLQEYNGNSNPLDPDSIPGQVLIMNMDEPAWTGVPNEVLDTSCYANHGAAINGATTTQDLWGAHGMFCGTNYVEVPDSESLQIVGDLTVSFWVKMTNNPTAAHYVIAKNNTRGEFGIGFQTDRRLF